MWGRKFENLKTNLNRTKPRSNIFFNKKKFRLHNRNLWKVFTNEVHDFREVIINFY